MCAGVFDLLFRLGRRLLLDVPDVSTQAQGDQCTGHKGDGVGGQVFEGGCVDVVHVVLLKVWVLFGSGSSGATATGCVACRDQSAESLVWGLLVTLFLVFCQMLLQQIAHQRPQYPARYRHEACSHHGACGPGFAAQ